MHCRVKKSKKVFINPLMMLIKEMPGIVIFLRLWFVTEFETIIFSSIMCDSVNIECLPIATVFYRYCKDCVHSVYFT